MRPPSREDHWVWPLPRSTAYTLRSTAAAVNRLTGDDHPAGEAPSGLGPPHLRRGSPAPARRRATASRTAAGPQAALTPPRRRARLNAPCDIPYFIHGPGMTAVQISALRAHVGETVTLRGWVVTTRSSGKIAFLVCGTVRAPCKGSCPRRKYRRIPGPRSAR